MTTNEKWQDVTERVQRGAEYLDEVRPGWRDAIDTDSLSLYSSCNCVLGQLFGLYDAHSRTMTEEGLDPAEYGFEIRAAESINREAYATLTAAWREYLSTGEFALVA